MRGGFGGGTEKRACGGREEDMIGQESKTKNENQPMRCNAVVRDVLRSLEME